MILAFGLRRPPRDDLISSRRIATSHSQSTSLFLTLCVFSCSNSGQCISFELVSVGLSKLMSKRNVDFTSSLHFTFTPLSFASRAIVTFIGKANTCLAALNSSFYQNYLPNQRNTQFCLNIARQNNVLRTKWLSLINNSMYTNVVKIV